MADIKREGRDISLVATSSMVQVALGAAAMLEEIGIDAEVVDPRTTWPLDEKTLIDSVRKTSRCIVIDEGVHRYGVTGRARVRHRRRRVLLISTVRSGESVPGTCRFRSRRRWRMRPSRPNATSSRWRDRCAISSGVGGSATQSFRRIAAPALRA